MGNTPIIGEEHKVVEVNCFSCGRPIMNTDDLKMEKVCPSCKKMNRLKVGPDKKLYQFIDEDYKGDE